VEFVSSSAVHDDVTAAGGEHKRNIAYDDQAPHDIDFKHAAGDVAPRAPVLVVADIVAEGWEDVFFDARDAHQEIALAAHVYFRRRVFMMFDFVLLSVKEVQ